jgi:hypothetical protein
LRKKTDRQTHQICNPFGASLDARSSKNRFFIKSQDTAGRR